ncbi:hypothetical protein [Streptomyces sp. NPDC046925]|uniref:hypothetical protein n=1 Tax=Streptomyces sp. NPDC046925 TaxID=3155375 RepID=UPI0033CCE56F
MHTWETRLVVRIAENPTHYPTAAFTMEMGENAFGGDEILEQLHKIASLDGKLEFPEMHQLSGRESQTNWGASGSFAEYVIEISANILSTAGAAGVGLLVHKAFSKIRARNDYHPEPLTLEAAQNLLKAHISLHYDIPHEELTEKESTSSLTDGAFTIVFFSPDGAEYGGSVGGEDPLQCTKVWRKNSGPAIRPEYRYITDDTGDIA